MGKPKKVRPDRKKKRQFYGNRFTKSNQSESKDSECSERPTDSTATHGDQPHSPLPSTSTDSTSQPGCSAQSTSSAAKLDSKLEEADVQFDKDDSLTGFRFIDCENLIEFVSQLLCPKCKQPLGANKRLFHVKEDRVSMASKFTFHCQCSHSVSLDTSKKCGKTHEVDRRFALSVFASGKHYTGGKKFLGNMNMPPPPQTKSWSLHKQKILQATKKVAKASKEKAATEIKDNKGTHITVSCDGTYQRRGFQSKNGVVTVLSVHGKQSKVLDTETLSNHCDSCTKNKKKKTDVDFQTWRENHELKGECDKNHTGSAGAMEPAGTETIFRRSETLYGLKYTTFLGDGDSKSYSTLKKADPPVYDTNIERLECCGHVQKRMGRHLMKTVTDNKNKQFKLQDGKITKGLGGKGKLTKKAILKIQGHFGAAIRNNAGNVTQMKRDIWAIWEHRNKEHSNCGGWCPSKSGKGDPNKNSFPDFVCQQIKPVFEMLTQDSLLNKCAHGGSQNTNESLHNIIWQRCPKTSFVGRKRISLAVEDSSIVYNDGESGRLSIFKELGMPEGYYTKLCFEELDRTRITASFIQANPAVKDARRKRTYEAAQLAEETEKYYSAGAHE